MRLSVKKASEAEVKVRVTGKRVAGGAQDEDEGVDEREICVYVQYFSNWLFEALIKSCKEKMLREQVSWENCQRSVTGEQESRGASAARVNVWGATVWGRPAMDSYQQIFNIENIIILPLIIYFIKLILYKTLHFIFLNINRYKLR